MLFNSYGFLIGFLPIVLAGFFVIERFDRRLAAIWLTLASFTFYGLWDCRFVPLLLGSILWNFTAGVLLSRMDRGKRVVLAVAIAGDLALLAYFKYAGFFLRTLDSAAGTAFGLVDIILPLGISFFTFTQIAFLVDTSRGEVREFNFMHYALFVTYFPHLIAGPILHHADIMPQFDRPSTYRPQADHLALGIAYFAIGLAKKCIIADSFAADAAAAFDAAAGTAALSAPTAWRGAFAYTLQLYFDFSGYTDMAIGLSRMFGVRLPLNFNSPYKATGIIEFWRRWHMSLSGFLRDYLYFPLGGNRRGRARRYVNLMVTMVLGGLWHGANWTFVVWGALHGAYLTVNRAWRALRPRRALERIPAVVRQVVATAVTFICVVIAWVVFRASDLPSAWRMLKSMAGAEGFALPPPPVAYGDLDLMLMGLGAPAFSTLISSLAFYAGALLIVFVMPNSQQIIEPGQHGTPAEQTFPALPVTWRPSAAWAILCACLIVISLMTFSRVTEFLYFQF